MISAKDSSSLATLQRFYDAETTYLLSAERDFAGIAATLDAGVRDLSTCLAALWGERRGYTGLAFDGGTRREGGPAGRKPTSPVFDLRQVSPNSRQRCF